MKKIALLYALLIISLMGCKEKPDAKSNSEFNLKNNSLSLRDSLIGKWGGLGERRPVWEIRKDSIYYFERSIAYPYKIINRDFVIYFPDHVGKLRSIGVDHDTMYFLDPQGITIKGFRFKK